MKVAILGAWHVHADSYTECAKKLGEVVGVYDADADRRAAFAKKHSIPEFATLEDLLACDAEAVICNEATNKHKDVLIAAANAGKHIFTERFSRLPRRIATRSRQQLRKIKFALLSLSSGRCSAATEALRRQ